MFTASWEIVDEDREDFGSCDTKDFSTIAEAEEWLGYRMNRRDYYCIIFNEHGQVVAVGWLP